jgi:peptidoglycan DL-endopeptidase CwlO
MRVTLGTRPGTGARRTRRGVAAGAALLLAGGLAVAVSAAAGAQPQPSITQVQATINTLTGQFNKANQQYDQVQEQLTAAKARLKQVNKQLDRAQAKYLAARKLVVQIADSAYEDSGSTSLAGLLTSGDPGQLLAQASLVLQVAGTRNTETRSFLADATQMASVQEEQQRTEQGIADLAGQMGKTRDHIAALLSKQKSILSSLTGAQLAQVQRGTVNSGGGITSAVYAGPTGTQADTAVAFAFKQLGCAYVYGGTGPCGAGFDCSGLMLKAWAAAGITIPRDTYSQWAALPHIAESAIQPGDLLYYNGIGHVAMYVGNGMIIDAPSQGQPVRELPMNESWYAGSFDGAARPLRASPRVGRHPGETTPVPRAPPGPTPAAQPHSRRPAPPPRPAAQPHRPGPPPSPTPAAQPHSHRPGP